MDKSEPVDKSDIVSDDPNHILLIRTEVEFDIRENTKGLTADNVRIRGNNEHLPLVFPAFQNLFQKKL